MNTASTSGSGPLPSNTIANPKGELKSITTRSGLVLDGPFVLMPPPFINPEEDERVEETLTDPKLKSPHLRKTFLTDHRALIDVHGEDMILRDEMDYILEDSIDESNLANPNDNLFDTMPKMFTDEHTLDYSSPSLYDDFDDDLFELESDNDDAYDDPFDSKGEKIKESKLLIDKLDLPRSSDFLPSPITVQITPDKNVKKIATTNASLILEDFNPPLYKLPFHKEVPGSETLLSFSFENEENFFKPEVLTSKGVHTSLLPELSHRGPKAFKVTKIVERPMEIFLCSFREDICILDVPCLHFYPP
nr:hypothetical protein [Tanacetum cinerariifolium]